MSKVQASVFMNLEPALSLSLTEQNVNPEVWADGKTVGPAQNTVPVVIKLKDPHLFPHQKHYPPKPTVKEGLKPILENLKEQGLLIPCNSPYNTPILDIKKVKREMETYSIYTNNKYLILILYYLKFLHVPNISQ